MSLAKTGLFLEPTAKLNLFHIGINWQQWFIDELLKKMFIGVPILATCIFLSFLLEWTWIGYKNRSRHVFDTFLSSIGYQTHDLLFINQVCYPLQYRTFAHYRRIVTVGDLSSSSTLSASSASFCDVASIFCR